MFIYFVFPSISFYLMSAQFWILLLLLIWHGKKKPLMYLLLMMIVCLPLTVLFNLPLSLSHWSAGNSSMLEGVQSASTAIRLYWLCATNRIDNQENCESYQTAKAQNNDQKMNLADGNFVFTSLCVCGALSLSLSLFHPFVLHTHTHTYCVYSCIRCSLFCTLAFHFFSKLFSFCLEANRLFLLSIFFIQEILCRSKIFRIRFSFHSFGFGDLLRQRFYPFFLSLLLASILRDEIQKFTTTTTDQKIQTSSQNENRGERL